MQTVSNFAALRSRIHRLLTGSESKNDPSQELFSANGFSDCVIESSASGTIVGFLRFLSASFPQSEIYIFGGLIRDVALFGKKGFNSDLDLVVLGDWPYCANFLVRFGAKKNKFGGFRAFVGGWPIDIWNAEETWAIKQGYVQWKDVRSLLETTVLNWDAILMDWRTGGFVCRQEYLSDLRTRYLDVVLKENPNPIGMAVRVFRHLCMKDARKISARAAIYLARATYAYPFDVLVKKERSSYGSISIDKHVYEFFSLVYDRGIESVWSAPCNAERLMKQRLVQLPARQQLLPFRILTDEPRDSIGSESQFERE